MTPLFFLSFHAFSLTDKYRLVWRDNPATTICVQWNVISGSNSRVVYDEVDHGTNVASYAFVKAYDIQENYRGLNNTFARITGLKPNTKYYFLIVDDNSVSRRFWFMTAPDNPNERLSIIAGGDSRSNDPARQRANKIVAKLRPHVVMFGGDFTGTTTNTEWTNWFNDWQLTIGTDGRIIPLVVAQGNHEAGGWYTDLSKLFDAPYQDNDPTKLYYAQNFGGSLLRVYTLNTEIPIGGDQTTWLNNDLNANPGFTWKMAQYHRPMRPHEAGKSEGNNQYNNWAQLFRDKDVKLIVECDAHVVKQTWPIVPSTATGSQEGFIRDDENGSVYVGEGCWGDLRTANDGKNWTRGMGSFTSYNWIFVDQCSIEIRTVMIPSNPDAIPVVSDNNRFQVPAGLNMWDPGNGDVIYINKSCGSPIVSLTAPVKEAYYATPQTITLKANASDAGGTITKVEFLVNGNLVGTVMGTPYDFNWTIPSDGKYTITARATDNDGNVGTSPAVNITVGTVTNNICSKASEDAEQNLSTGSVSSSSSDLELVYDGVDQIVGIRFSGLNIPKGVTISAATIEFTAKDPSSGTCNLSIFGEASDNSATFSSTTNNISSRTKTTATVNWAPAAWTTAGGTHSTPDLKSIIQEIVNRSGYANTSAITILFTGTGTRRAWSIEGNADAAPKICITYVTGGPPNASPTVNITSPSNGSYFSVSQEVNIAANANDSDGTISVVDFYVDGVKVGSDFTGPYNFAWSPSAAGDYTITVVAIDDKGASSTSSEIKITVNQLGVFTVTSKITASSDDAEELIGNAQPGAPAIGSVSLTSSDLELNHEAGVGDNMVGLRFSSVNIPKTAIIHRAYIQFTVDEANPPGGATITIRGQAADNPATFTNTNGNISSRPKTSASVTWSVLDWSFVGDQGPDQRTPDLKQIINEIISRPGWMQGNAMAFFTSGTGLRTADAYDKGPAGAAYLVIEYSDQPLAISFISLEVNKTDDRSVSVAWSSFIEEEMKYFVELEREDNPGNVQIRQTVFSDSKGLNRFEVKVDNLVPGRYYFRVKQENQKGDVQFSERVLVDIGVESLFYLFPNPCSDKIRLVSDLLDPVAVELYDFQGSLKGVWNFDAEIEERTLLLEGFSPGIYFVKIKNHSAENIIKVVKE